MPRLPLARAYRPRLFAEVLGQQAAVRALAAAAERGDVASAYIFSGTRGIGKTTIARIFAKTLNCEQAPAADCCGTCSSCVEISEGRSLDVLELDAATHTGIDDIRELREAAQYPPGRDRYRVFILDEAHQLSTAAWNGLLKILEEPPPWCVFLFCTTEPHKIPPTIESRALHFAFRSPSPTQIREHLARIASAESLEIDDDALDLLVRAADGSVRDGLSALDQTRALAAGRLTAAIVRDALGLIADEAIVSYLEALADGDAARALGVVTSLEEEGQDLRTFTADILARVRDILVVQVASTPGAAVASGAGALAPRFRLEHLLFMGRVLDETETRLRQGGPQRTLLDLATVRMTQIAGLADLGAVAAALASAATAPPREPGGSGGPGAARRPGTPSGSPPPPSGRNFRTRGTDETADGGPSRAGSVPPPASPPFAAPPATPYRHDAGENLLDALVAALPSIRSSLTAYVARLEAAYLDERGVLKLRAGSAAGNAGWLGRLQTEQAREALAEAVLAACGRTIEGIAIESSSQAATTSEPAERAPSRDAVLEMARRDPLVRKLFDRFGAVIVDGQPLEAPPPPPPPDGPALPRGETP